MSTMDLLLDGEQTDRLVFRKLNTADFDCWLPFHQDPRSTQYWEGIPKNPIEANEEQFNRTFERYRLGLGGMNALVLKSTQELVGICGLLVQTVDDRQELEIGYSILPQYWGQGYATEAALKCRDHAFKNELSDTLISIIHVDNIPSRKVAQKNGMRFLKTTTYKDNPVHIYWISSGDLPV